MIGKHVSCCNTSNSMSVDWLVGYGLGYYRCSALLDGLGYRCSALPVDLHLFVHHSLSLDCMTLMGPFVNFCNFLSNYFCLVANSGSPLPGLRAFAYLFLTEFDRFVKTFDTDLKGAKSLCDKYHCFCISYQADTGLHTVCCHDL